MKKSVILTAIAALSICLTACGTEAPAVQSNTATTAAVSDITTTAATALTTASTSASAAATTTAAQTTAAQTSAAASATQKQASAKLGNPIFGGYVTADTAVKSKADEKAETLLTIPDGTQISVYESDTKGWFMTDFKNTAGYIPTGSVKDIPPFDPENSDNLLGGSVTKDVNLMSGTHSYAEVLAKIPKGTQINYYVDAADANWCVINYQGKIGYAEAKDIKAIENSDQKPAGQDDNNAQSHIDEYVGKWEGDKQWNGCNLYVQISKDGDQLKAVASAHSAVADYEWNYTCIASEDHTYIECANGGVLKRTDYAPDGEKQEPVVVYNDGGAKFSIRGGTLFWQEFKEDVAKQVGFKQIG